MKTPYAFGVHVRLVIYSIKLSNLDIYSFLPVSKFWNYCQYSKINYL